MEYVGLALLFQVRLRTFCIMGQRLTLCCKVKPLGGAVAKASLNRANEYHGVDPKSGDLSMDRVKVE